MNDWMNHPAMENIDPVKLVLIKAAASKINGKNGNQMATVMMALITTARQKGIQFSPEEMTLILEVLKDGKSEEEQGQIDGMVNMVMNMVKTHSSKK